MSCNNNGIISECVNARLNKACKTAHDYYYSDYGCVNNARLNIN